MKILKMKLENFQGIKAFEFSPEGASVSVYGDNGTGKTTIYNAFCFLMYGKPSTAEKGFTPQTAGIHNLNHVVEMTIETDSPARIMTLKKDYHEVYQTRTGKTEKEFKGCTTDHYIDGVPVKQKEYQEVLEDLIHTDETAKILTRYNYFLEDMNIKDRRRLLLDVCGDISMDDVISTDPKFEKLHDVIGFHEIEDYLKIAQESKKKINDEFKEIPNRIDEANRTLTETSGQPEDELLEKRDQIKKEIDSLREEKASVYSTADADIKKQIAETEAECLKAESEHFKKYSDLNKTAFEEVDKIKVKVNDLRREIQNKTADAARIRAVASRMEHERKTLLDEWQTTKAQEWQGDTICPTCGQEFPAERIDELKAKFNKHKAEKLEQISSMGAEVSETKIADEKKKADALDEEAKGLQDDLTAKEKELADAEAKITNPVVFDKTPFSKKIADLNAQRESILATIGNRVMALDDKIKASEDILQDLNTKLAGIQLCEKTKERIKELETRQSELAAEAETLEYNIKLCQDFNRQKAKMLDGAINSHFKTLKFRLFKELNNGGLEDDCEAMIPIDGTDVEFKTANNASRINAGLEVIDSLARYYGLSLPVFIDNAEGCTKINPTGTQQIRLYVSEKDKKLRVEKE